MDRVFVIFGTFKNAKGKITSMNPQVYANGLIAARAAQGLERMKRADGTPFYREVIVNVCDIDKSHETN